MQDRHRRIVEIFLLRTAGPYIRVNFWLRLAIVGGPPLLRKQTSQRTFLIGSYVPIAEVGVRSPLQ